MKRLFLCLFIALLFLFSFIQFIAIKEQAQRIAELEKGVLYFKAEAAKLRIEQDKQARLIEQDLYIFVNGYEKGK